MPERLSRLTTDAEQRWLTGDAPRPPAPAERLPVRRAVLLPRPGTDAWTVPALRDRIVVRAGEVTLLRGRKTRSLAAPAAIRRVVWLESAAVPDSLRWPPSVTGYVWLDADRPVVLRLDDWLAGDLLEATSAAVRIAGVEALAREVGAPLEVGLSDGSAALPGWRAVVLARRGFLHPLASVGCLLLGWGLGFGLSLAGADVAAAVVALLLLLAPAVFDVAGTWHSRRLLDAAVGAAGPVYRNGAARIVRRTGPAGDELLLTDGTGWVCVLPGPALGGASSLVVAREEPTPGRPAEPWGILVLDRDERFLAALPAARWLPAPDRDAAAALVEVLAAPDGLEVSTAVVPRWPEDRVQSRVRPAGAADPDVYRVGSRTSLAGLFGAAIFAGPQYHVLPAIPFGVAFVLVLVGQRLRPYR